MTINSLSSFSAISQIAAYDKLNQSSQVSQTDGVEQDSSQVSELGKLMQQLESLQQSDPDQFKQMTAQIADKLEAAAKEAADGGDSRQAGALNDLASKFKTASETGRMPDLRHGGPPPMGPPPADSTSSTTSQLLSSYQSQSTDPMSVLTGILKNLFSSTETSSS